MTSIFCLALLLVVSVALPFRDQLALVNSLQVGRNEDPETWACVGCDTQNKPLHAKIIERKHNDVKALLSVYQEYTVLSFRYTATVKNLFQDLLWSFQVKDDNACKDCKIQKEYNSMWNSIRDQIIDGLRQNAHTGRLVITGISLGGGLACLSFGDIRNAKIFSNIEVVTFGAPRVGNTKWAQWFDTQTPSIRYYIEKDPIPLFPRCLTPICQYKQTGTAIACNKKSQTCQKVGASDAKTPFNPIEILQELVAESAEYVAMNEDPELGGIIDHIFGYKKIRDYTLKE